MDTDAALHELLHAPLAPHARPLSPSCCLPRRVKDPRLLGPPEPFQPGDQPLGLVPSFGRLSDGNANLVHEAIEGGIPVRKSRSFRNRLVQDTQGGIGVHPIRELPFAVK